MTFGHYGLTFHNVTSGQKAPLGRILRNFWLRMRTPKGTPKESRDLWSLPVAMVLVLLYYLYYNYSKKKARETEKSAVTSLPVAPPQRLFELCLYTTVVDT